MIRWCIELYVKVVVALFEFGLAFFALCALADVFC